MNDIVLLIEDDLVLCQMLQVMLASKGFQVEVANNALAGLKKAYAIKPAVIILDIMLPDLDGWQACVRFREMSDVPIIMLTALGSVENITKGLNLGADDYIVKPVSAEHLAARIHAVLRRVSRSKVARNPNRTAIFAYDNLFIDFDRHEVKIGDEGVNLTPTEFRLLSLLVQHKGRILPHDFLLREVWGMEYTNEVEYLRLYIGYLRRKLEKDASRPSLIQNEWGTGYRFGEQ